MYRASNSLAFGFLDLSFLIYGLVGFVVKVAVFGVERGGTNK